MIPITRKIVAPPRRSAYSRRARAASAITPPSPLLSARMSTSTYLIDTTTVTLQNMIEMTP